MGETGTWQETVKTSHTVTLQDTTAMLTRLADKIDDWIRLGAHPPVPEDLLRAAERITAAMRIYRPTATTTQMSISQLVLSLAVPGKDVTAKDLQDQLARCGRTTTNRAISLALHRATTRGILERPRRGVYRLADPEGTSTQATSERPVETPPEPRKDNERSPVHAVATFEEEEPM